MGKRVQKLLIYIFIKVSRDVVVPPLGACTGGGTGTGIPKSIVILYRKRLETGGFQ